jgi:hypothetical protein
MSGKSINSQPGYQEYQSLLPPDPVRTAIITGHEIAILGQELVKDGHFENESTTYKEKFDKIYE